MTNRKSIPSTFVDGEKSREVAVLAYPVFYLQRWRTAIWEAQLKNGVQLGMSFEVMEPELSSIRAAVYDIAFLFRDDDSPLAPLWEAKPDLRAGIALALLRFYNVDPRTERELQALVIRECERATALEDEQGNKATVH